MPLSLEGPEIMVGIFVVGTGDRMVGRGGLGGVGGAAVHVVLVVAGAQVLVEDGPVPAVEGVLLPVSMAEVVDLKKERERGKGQKKLLCFNLSSFCRVLHHFRKRRNEE